MALDPNEVNTVGTPAWWMVQLSRKLLDRNRQLRLGILEAYRCGRPPLPGVPLSQRESLYELQQMSRSNFARVIVRAPGQRMAVRAIRTAAVNDDAGDEVAWRYWTGAALDVASTDVISDMLTFSEGYVRAGVTTAGQPIALRRDPRFTVTAQNPLNPNETIAGFELLWDEWTSTIYAFLWLPGKQYVATRPMKMRPAQFRVPGVTFQDATWSAFAWWPRLSFDPSNFTMRPDITDVPPVERDDQPYSQTFPDPTLMPIVAFPNRDGVGEFEEHLGLLNRINRTILDRVVISAIQAFKQRALEQDDSTTDRLPDKDPNTGEPINWDDIFQPGPDALWKLPPGVKIWESSEVQLQGVLSAITDDLKHLAVTTETPFSIFSPDAANQSAEGASGNKEMLVFKVEDRCRIAARSFAKVISLMFQFAPDADRYDAEHNDRADAGKIVLDWMPAERYSLQEKATADSLNKSLSADMAAVKVWGLTPDEVAINKAQRSSDLFAAAALNPSATSGKPAAS